MMRPVEIPEAVEVAATEAALAAGFVDPDDGTIPQWLGDGKPPVWTHPSEAVKVILAAALPYLAPAGDGGLREALEKLVAEWRADADGDEKYMPRAHASEIHEVEASMKLNRMNADVLEQLLAAHPAAPAVPQPVDREAVRMVLINFGIDLKMEGAHPEVGASEMVDAAVDAVLALLAGEREQVESP